METTFSLALPSEFLLAGRTLIDHPSKWVQHYYARNDIGHAVDVTASTACKFCSIGAVMRLAEMDVPVFTLGSTASTVRDYLRQAAKELYGENCTVIGVNDWGEHDKVMAMWDKAIALAKQDEAAKAKTPE